MERASDSLHAAITTLRQRLSAAGTPDPEGQAALESLEHALASTGEASSAPAGSRALLASLTESYFHIGRDWRIDDINASALRFFNREHAELVGRSVWELPPAGADSLFQGGYLQAMETGQVLHFESPSRLADGWAEVFVLPDADGLAVFFNDISLRKSTEDALRESNRRLRSVLNSITEAYYVLDRQWRLVDFNRVAERDVLKLPPQELLGKVFWEVFPHTIGGEFYRQYHRAFAAGQPVHFEAFGTLAPYWFEVHAYPRGDVLEVYLHNIHERKVSEQRLAYQAHLLESAHDAVVAVDQNNVITAWNKAAEEMYGWQASEVIGESLNRIVPSDVTDNVRQMIDKSIKKQGRFTIQMAQYDRAGKRMVIESSGIALRDERGNITGITAINRDVSAQVETQRALAESENRLRTTLENLPMGVWLADQTGKIIYGNPAGQRIWSGARYVEPSQFHVYKGWWLETGERIRSEDWALSRAVKRGEISLNEKIEIECFDGSRKIINNSAIPLRNEQGELIGAVSLNQDITHDIYLQHQVEAERARMEAVLDSLPVAVFISDAEGRIMAQNQQAEYLVHSLKYLPQDLKDFTTLVGWHAATGERIQPGEWPLAQAIQRGEVVSNFEADVERKDGTRATLLMSAAPVNDASGKLIGGVVVRQDISERRQVEEALRASEAKVRRLIDANLIGVLYGQRGVITEANQAFMKMTGYTPEHIHNGGLRWREITPTEYLAMDAVGEAEAKRRGECTPYEKEFIGANGSRIPVLIGYAYLSENQDEYVAFVVDLSERKQSERSDRFLAELGHSILQTYDVEKRTHTALRQLGENVAADRCALVDLDLRGGQVRVTGQYYSGLAPIESVFGLDEWPQSFSEEMARGQTIVLADVHRDGRLSEDDRQWYLDHQIESAVLVPRLGFDGWLATLVVANKTPRHWREQEVALIRSAADLIWLALRNARLLANLHETQRRFDLALRNSPIVVYTTDRDLRFTWLYNLQPGYEGVNWIGKRASEVFGSDTESELEQFAQIALETGVGGRKEVHTVDLKGNPRVFDMTVEPLRGENDAVEGVAVSAIDVTGQRRMEHEMEIRELHLELQRKILEQREMERVEIARELHDGPLQELIAVNFGLMDALGINKKEERLERIRMLQEAIQNQIRELRVFCSELRPPALAPFGLESAIRSHADIFRQKNPDIRLTMDLMHDGKSLTEEIRLALYRIYQELMNNVVRHSAATDVTVRLWLDEHELTLMVEDNGTGFNVPSDWLDMARQGHLGLVGVQERAESISGKLQIFSTPGRGTTVQVTAPRKLEA